MNKDKISGRHGCCCHYYKDWEECDFYHNQKLTLGDRVKSRCTNKLGTVITEEIDVGFVVIKYDDFQSDREYIARLIKL